MSEKSEKWPAQFPKAQGDMLKWHALSNQQSKLQTYSIYSDIKQWKSANTHNREAGTREGLNN